MVIKEFKELIKPCKPGRPMFGDEPKRSKSLSLDQEVIEWIVLTGGSAKANLVLRQAMEKEGYDARG